MGNTTFIPGDEIFSLGLPSIFCLGAFCLGAFYLEAFLHYVAIAALPHPSL